MYQTETPIFGVHHVLKDLTGITFREKPTSKVSRESSLANQNFWGQKMDFKFANLAKFLPAKISSLKVSFFPWCRSHIESVSKIFQVLQMQKIWRSIITTCQERKSKIKILPKCAEKECRTVDKNFYFNSSVILFSTEGVNVSFLALLWKGKVKRKIVLSVWVYKKH